MKINHLIGLAGSCGALLLIFGCESQQQPADQFFKRNKNADERASEKKNAQAPKIISKVKKELPNYTVVADEFTVYTLEINKKISENEIKIKEMKALPNKNQKWFKNISRLELRNEELKTKLAEYQELLKINWEKFKLDLNQELLEINTDLKEIDPAQAARVEETNKVLKNA